MASFGAAVGAGAHVYQRRQPENTLLYQTIAENWATFLRDTADQGGHLPWFVHREFAAYLDCGILANGFLRVRCGDCGRDQFVAFSCKKRSVCPSCGVRRMEDGAAHIVDNILPQVPVRQWVLSLPFWLRFRVAYDSGLCSQVLGLFSKAVQRWYRHTAKSLKGLDSVKVAHGGSVTCIQRFSSALSLNVHFHTLVLDGVYIEEAEDQVAFLALPPPTVADLQEITDEVCRKVATLLGMTEDDATEPTGLVRDEPLWAACAAASVRGRIATGDRHGRPVERLGMGEPRLPTGTSLRPNCAQTEGYNLHAGVRVRADDRSRLRRLVRYILRPPISQERLEKLSDGRLVYRLKRAWSDGTDSVVFSGLELIEKLVALVPPPRVHQIVYHGVLSSRARLRPLVVPHAAVPPEKHETYHAPKRTRLDWATLLKRVYAIDVLVCQRCGGAMKIIAAITQVKVIQAILRSCGLPSAPPSRRPAPLRAHQQEWDW